MQHWPYQWRTFMENCTLKCMHLSRECVQMDTHISGLHQRSNRVLKCPFECREINWTNFFQNPTDHFALVLSQLTIQIVQICVSLVPEGDFIRWCGRRWWRLRCRRYRQSAFVAAEKFFRCFDYHIIDEITPFDGDSLEYILHVQIAHHRSA